MPVIQGGGVAYDQTAAMREGTNDFVKAAQNLQQLALLRRNLDKESLESAYNVFKLAQQASGLPVQTFLGTEMAKPILDTIMELTSRATGRSIDGNIAKQISNSIYEYAANPDNWSKGTWSEFLLTRMGGGSMPAERNESTGQGKDEYNTPTPVLKGYEQTGGGKTGGNGADNRKSDEIIRDNREPRVRQYPPPFDGLPPSQQFNPAYPTFTPYPYQPPVYTGVPSDEPTPLPQPATQPEPVMQPQPQPDVTAAPVPVPGPDTTPVIVPTPAPDLLPETQKQTVAPRYATDLQMNNLFRDLLNPLNKLVDERGEPTPGGMALLREFERQKQMMPPPASPQPPEGPSAAPAAVSSQPDPVRYPETYPDVVTGTRTQQINEVLAAAPSKPAPIATTPVSPPQPQPLSSLPPLEVTKQQMVQNMVKGVPGIDTLMPQIAKETSAMVEWVRKSYPKTYGSFSDDQIMGEFARNRNLMEQYLNTKIPQNLRTPVKDIVLNYIDTVRNTLSKSGSTLPRTIIISLLAGTAAFVTGGGAGLLNLGNIKSVLPGVLDSILKNSTVTGFGPQSSAEGSEDYRNFEKHMMERGIPVADVGRGVSDAMKIPYTDEEYLQLMRDIFPRQNFKSIEEVRDWLTAHPEFEPITETRTEKGIKNPQLLTQTTAGVVPVTPAQPKQQEALKVSDTIKESPVVKSAAARPEKDIMSALKLTGKISTKYTGPNANITADTVQTLTDGVFRLFGMETPTFKDKSIAHQSAVALGKTYDKLWNSLSKEDRDYALNWAREYVNSISPSEAQLVFGNDMASIRLKEKEYQARLNEAAAQIAATRASVEAAGLGEAFGAYSQLFGSFLNFSSSLYDASTKKGFKTLTEAIENDPAARLLYNNITNLGNQIFGQLGGMATTMPRFKKTGLIGFRRWTEVEDSKTDNEAAKEQKLTETEKSILSDYTGKK